MGSRLRGRVLPPAVVARAQERAAPFAALPTKAIAMTKRLFERAAASRLEDQLELEAQLQLAATRTDDYAEGVASFLEKREPRFSGSWSRSSWRS